ncbi:MAG: hypothetical protein ACRDLT_01310 [Solirubrobacteraceae bacterium]
MRDAVGSSAFTSGHHIRRLAPTLVAALLAAAYLIVQPSGADLPAQLLRVKLFAAAGFGLWDNWWYGGHYLLGYSVLFPPLGWLLGPRLLAALACLGTAAACEALAHDIYGDDAWLGATWLGAATVTELLSGRLTFALGLCGAALTALLLERRRPRLAAVLACATALASPVAGLFVALVGAALTWRGLKVRNRADIAAGITAISAQILLLGGAALLFPTAGYQPFAFTTLWPLVGAGLLIVALRPGPMLATATLLYLAGCLAAYAINTPVGSNAARLGELVAGPLVALLLVPRRAWLLLALAALPLTYLQVHDAITDLVHGTPDRSASYYRPLIGFLRGQPGAWRVEVPFTAGHWESDLLAPSVPLARGWERQTDIAEDPLFYDHQLTAASYDAWLHRLAVRYVAAADAPADYSARAELRLIQGGLPYLHVVRRFAHWTVYAVADPTPVATGAGRVVSIGTSTLRLDVAHPGAIYVRVRWSPYWQLRGVRGCVAAAGQFTRIDAGGAGVARLQMGFSLGRVGSRAPRCD